MAEAMCFITTEHLYSAFLGGLETLRLTPDRFKKFHPYLILTTDPCNRDITRIKGTEEGLMTCIKGKDSESSCRFLPEHSDHYKFLSNDNKQCRIFLKGRDCSGGYPQM